MKVSEPFDTWSRKKNRAYRMDRVTRTAVERRWNNGTSSSRQIDKIAGRESGHGRLSREGVQRDICPSLKAPTVNTRYGMVTPTIFFSSPQARSTFSKPATYSRLQGRFPIRLS